MQINSLTTQKSLGLMGWLLVFWIASFPLKNYYLFTAFSIDNLLVPILFSFWLISIPFTGDKIRLQPFLLVMIILFIGSGLDHRVFQGGLGFQESIWGLGRDTGYFLIPILLISSLWRIRSANAAVMLTTAIGALSALLVSTGLLELEYVRFEESRIGIKALRKATGVFTNFGDLALLSAYTVACLRVYEGRDLPFFMSTKWMKGCVIIGLITGVVGTQSRNVLISILVAFFSFSFMKFLVKISNSRRNTIFLILLPAGSMLVALAVFFIQKISSGLSSIGGGRAANTAQARLDSYFQAFELIPDSIISGINYSNLAHVALAENLHNIWIGLLLRGGFINVFSTLFIIIYTLIGVLWLIRKNPSNKEVMIIGTFMPTLLVSTMFFPGGSLIYWFLLGLSMTIQLRRNIFL